MPGRDANKVGETVIIAIDFDGTIVEHRYPDIGEPVPEAFRWMREWQRLGAKLILWTMRCDSEKEGPVLTDAVEFCRKNGVEFWGVNQNPDQSWSKSPKAYANIYVDDAALGCPLKFPHRGRGFVNWSQIGPQIADMLQAKSLANELKPVVQSP